MKAIVAAGELLSALATEHRPTTGPAPPPTAAPGMPSPYVLQRLASWRLLHDVPFAYLVPAATLLPAEGIRFFHLDTAWLDALTDAALALGTDAPTWEVRAPRVLPVTRRPLLGSMRWVREVRRGRVVVDGGPGGLPWPPDPSWPPEGTAEPGTPPVPPPVTGFLLRSALVSRWRGTQVRAWTTPGVPLGADPGSYAAQHPDHVVPILRLERLSPGVLIVLFGGQPRMVWLEEPHHGVQLGVDVAFRDKPVPTVSGSGGREREPLLSYSVAVRDESGRPTGQVVPVPMRPGAAPGVLDVRALAEALDIARPLAEPRGGAAMGLALLQPPARQRFAGSAS